MHKCTPPLAAAVAVALAGTAHADVVVSTTALDPDAGIIANEWPGTPLAVTTTTPDDDSTTSNGGDQTSFVTLTYTPTQDILLDAFSIVAAGGPSLGLLNIYVNPVGGTEDDGFVNLSFSPPLVDDDVGSGDGLNFEFLGTPGETILTFDLTGDDEIVLEAGNLYAFDFKAQSLNDPYNFFVRRGGAFFTDGGNIYARNELITDDGQRFDVAGGGRRDAPLALYGTVLDPSLPGDANNDGVVDLADFGILRSEFGMGGDMLQADFNGDMTVDLADFGILRANFGASAELGALDAWYASVVPEPTSAALAGLAAMGLLRRARRG